MGKVLFGRKRKFIFEFKRWSLVLPCHSKLPIVIVVTEGDGLESSPGPLHAKPTLYPLSASPACAIALTMSPAFLVWCGAGDALMHADGVTAHCQWPTPSPLPRSLFPPPTLPFLCLFWGVNSGSLLPILLDKCSTSELHLQPSTIVQCY